MIESRNDWDWIQHNLINKNNSLFDRVFRGTKNMGSSNNVYNWEIVVFNEEVITYMELGLIRHRPFDTSDNSELLMSIYGNVYGDLYYEFNYESTTGTRCITSGDVPKSHHSHTILLKFRYDARQKKLSVEVNGNRLMRELRVEPLVANELVYPVVYTYSENRVKFSHSIITRY